MTTTKQTAADTPSAVLPTIATIAQQIRDNLSVSEKPKAHFLNVPRKLRDSIYGYVLLGRERIDMTDRPHDWELALLQTSCQIRKEAISIYFTKNRFLITTHNCDCRAIVAFCKLAAKYCNGKSAQSVLKVHVPTQVVWNNLRDWLKAYHAEPKLIPELNIDGAGKDKTTSTVVKNAFAMVRDMDDMPWAEVEPALQTFKKKLAGVAEDDESDEYDDEYDDGGDWVDHGGYQQFMSRGDVDDAWSNDY